MLSTEGLAYVIEECNSNSDAWRAVLAKAIVAAFFGDRKCSRENISDSCFGAEWCNANNNRIEVPGEYAFRLMQNNTCYAAIHARKKTFLGIIVLSRTAPRTIHSFCVTKEARRHRLGSALMEHLLRRHGHLPLHLTVARNTSGGNTDAGSELDARYDKLLTFYGKFGFVVTTRGSDHAYTHMQRPAPLRCRCSPPAR